jgi:hypothetical protein
VGNVGWENACWSDDNLSSKKLYPQFQFPAKGKNWQARIRTCDESMDLMVQRAQNVMEKMPAYLRKKPELAHVEQLAERASACFHIGKELQTSVPIPTAVIEKEWLHAWATGSDHIDVELQAALLEKSDSFQPINIPTLRKLVDDFRFTTPVQQSVDQAETIAVDEFNLLMKQLNYDVKVFQNWEKKCSSVHHAREYARHAHRLAQNKKCEQAATHFFDACVKLTTFDNDAAEIIAEVMNFKRDVIAKTSGGFEVHKIPSVVFLNWSSPCLIPVGNQDSQIGVLSWCLHDNMQSTSLVIYPVFTYMKGKLHLEEGKATTQLTKGNHNLDTTFSVVFKEQCDPRDLRPMVYPGRFVFASPLGDPSKNMWFSSELRRQRRTEDVKQLPAKQMKEVEDLSAQALPVSTDGRDRARGAAKYNQLGPLAWHSMIQSLLDGPDFGDVPAVLFVDLHPRTGDLLESFCKKRQQYSQTSLFYFGVCESQMEQDWITASIKDMMVESFQDGSTTLPGNLRLEDKINEDLLDPIPPLPQMNLLTVGGAAKNELQMPSGVAKKWQFHPIFGGDFVPWLDEFATTYKVVDDQAEMAAKTPSKRGQKDESGAASESVSAAEPSPKKRKLDLKFIVESNSITHPLLLEVKMQVKGLMLQIRAGHQVYITNMTAQEISLGAYTFVAGFGKGGFKLIKEGEAGLMEFKIADQNTMVFFNNMVMTVGKVLQDQRKKKPDCNICYHTITPDDSDPAKFECVQNHRVVFTLKDKDKESSGAGDDGELNQSSIASKEATKSWSTSVLITLWSVRWSAKGLMPVKPLVFICAGASLPVGRSLHCHADAVSE